MCKLFSFWPECNHIYVRRKSEIKDDRRQGPASFCPSAMVHLAITSARNRSLIFGCKMLQRHGLRDPFLGVDAFLTCSLAGTVPCQMLERRDVQARRILTVFFL